MPYGRGGMRGDQEKGSWDKATDKKSNAPQFEPMDQRFDNLSNAVTDAAKNMSKKDLCEMNKSAIKGAGLTTVGLGVWKKDGDMVLDGMGTYKQGRSIDCSNKDKSVGSGECMIF